MMTVAMKSPVDPNANELVVDELVRRARLAQLSFTDADQARVDEAVHALAWSIYNPAHAQSWPNSRSRYQAWQRA